MKNSLTHISLIMDGNNRWSKKNGFSKFDSYSKGAKKLIDLSSFIFEKTDIKFITAFALSSNNLNRSKKIIDIILSVLDLNLDRALNEKLNYSISIRGDLNFLSINLKNKIKLLEKKNYSCDKKLVILLNYSGRKDILNAFLKINSSKKNITISSIYNNLILSDMPDPDIMIRTGGFKRISDFLLFNISFTELFFTNKLWPDLNIGDLKKFFKKFQTIERKFGL